MFSNLLIVSMKEDVKKGGGRSKRQNNDKNTTVPNIPKVIPGLVLTVIQIGIRK